MSVRHLLTMPILIFLCFVGIWYFIYFMMTVSDTSMNTESSNLIEQRIEQIVRETAEQYIDKEQLQYGVVVLDGNTDDIKKEIRQKLESYFKDNYAGQYYVNFKSDAKPVADMYVDQGYYSDNYYFPFQSDVNPLNTGVDQNNVSLPGLVIDITNNEADSISGVGSSQLSSREQLSAVKSYQSSNSNSVLIGNKIKQKNFAHIKVYSLGSSGNKILGYFKTYMKTGASEGDTSSYNMHPIAFDCDVDFNSYSAKSDSNAANANNKDARSHTGDTAYTLGGGDDASIKEYYSNSNWNTYSTKQETYNERIGSANSIIGPSTGKQISFDKNYASGIDVSNETIYGGYIGLGADIKVNGSGSGDTVNGGGSTTTSRDVHKLIGIGGNRTANGGTTW